MIYVYRKFSYKSRGERIFKISPHLPKLSSIKQLTFLEHDVLVLGLLLIHNRMNLTCEVPPMSSCLCVPSCHFKRECWHVYSQMFYHQCCVGGGLCVAATAWPRRGWHASRVPLVNCLSPVESGLSIERGVYQGVVSSRDQEDDQPTNRCACGAPCAQEHYSQVGQCVQKPRCDGLPGTNLVKERSCRNALDQSRHLQELSR